MYSKHANVYEHAQMYTNIQTSSGEYYMHISAPFLCMYVNTQRL